MNLVLFVLSVAGLLAALRRFAQATLRLFKEVVETFVSGEVARARADRGDVTGLMEAREQRQQGRRAVGRSLLEVSFWLVAVIAPLLASVTMEIYAAYSILWVLPLLKRGGP
jgi:hypothetical protein